MEMRTIAAIEAEARKFVDSFNDAKLIAITRGEYPASFATFSAKRIGVYTRAALIVLDARAGAHPESVELWSKKALEDRIAAVRRAARPTRISISADDATRRREIASGVKLDSSWQTTPIRLQGARRRS